MNIPKEPYFFDDSGMAKWIKDEVSAAKKRKAMCDVTSRFGNKLTSDFELKKLCQRGSCRKAQRKAQFGPCAISSPGVIGKRSKATQYLKIYLNVTMEKC